MVNWKGYGKVTKMVIDERREKIDILDYCLIEVELDKERREKEER